MKPTRIMLADDHGLIRAGIRELLERMDGIEVIAEAGDGREAVRLCNTHQPDIVVMDIGMPELNGLDSTAQIKKDLPHVQVLMLSMHTNDQYVVRALQSGASGYLLKNSAKVELEIAIRAMIAGQTYLSPAISKCVISNYLQPPDEHAEEVAEDEIGGQLTARQREVLQLIAESHTTKKMAETLHLSVKTIETYRAQLMARLDIHDIAGLVRYAVRAGLVSPER